MHSLPLFSLVMQPKINGARSDDAVYGWGGKNGYVYQKAYIECFMSPSHLKALMEVRFTAAIEAIAFPLP